MNNEEKYKNLVRKATEFSRKEKIDLSSDEDLSIAIMNLLSIEEHFFFTGAKTGKSGYYDLLHQIRETRKDLLKKIVKDYEGEAYCIQKHLLAASMRLIEVGTKQLSQNNKKEAEGLFRKAYDLYSLFWGINLKAVDISEVKKIDDNQLNVADKKKTGFMGKIEELVKKVIDCCIE